MIISTRQLKVRILRRARLTARLPNHLAHRPGANLRAPPHEFHAWPLGAAFACYCAAARVRARQHVRHFDVQLLVALVDNNQHPSQLLEGTPMGTPSSLLASCVLSVSPSRPISRHHVARPVWPLHITLHSVDPEWPD
jgi:hypothetical protein